MKILVIGSGGREHAIVWRLRQCSSVETVWCAPGNGGISQDAECFPLDPRNVSAAADLAAKLGADLTVAGPELPLVLGIADEFARRDMILLGPPKAAAQLEGSKVFAKEFMQRHGIPTAPAHGVHSSTASALMALNSARLPVAIKADGLCAGKGVLVTASREDAAAFIECLLDAKEFGDAGKRVLLETALSGEELSYIVLTDGKNFVPMAPARDHKRAFDNDEGPNTGGMGAYSSDDILPPKLESQIVDTIVLPTLQGLRQEGLPYRGFLYFGLMLTTEGPKVLEYNCRLGDPEAEAILLRADFDLGEAFLQAARGNLSAIRAKWTPGASLCVVMASQGYPGNPIVERSISGLDKASKVPGGLIFHAGTRRNPGGQYYTTGGRVLVAGAEGGDLAGASRKAYSAIEKISIEGAFFRRDIGASATGKSRSAAEKQMR